MPLITKELEVGVSHSIKHYEDLGYIIPKHFNNRKWCVKHGTKILVKVEHL